MYTQDNKVFSINTPLGSDILLLARFKGQEGLSELFSFDMDLFSEQHSISFEDIIGKNVTVSVSLADGSTRFFNGLIASFSQEYSAGNKSGSELIFSSYSATMVPWPWLLTRTVNSRIFQNLSVQDIIEQIFSDKNFVHFKFNLSRYYETREYTVQYRESDFNFVSRLLEEEGIYYFFVHEDGKHTLVMTDNSGIIQPCYEQEAVKFKLSGGGSFGNEDEIDSLKMVKQIQAGKYTLNDYNYEIPYADLKVTSDTALAIGPGELEKYDYPGGYAKRDAGDALASIRMEEEESRISILSGTSDCRAFTSGYRFKLEASSQEEWNDKNYILTNIIHRADQADSYASGTPTKERGKIYSNQFDCISYEMPFRPRRITPIPKVEGVQTAVVVGPSGEEIYTDEHGRVKVKFHWDRKKESDENSSCWLRVAQSMAGNGWGTMFLPRVGNEVIVEFLEGNPDRPIVTGQVYHGVNLPPYELPNEKTKSTFKSSCSPDGDGFNEIRFEDKRDEEQLFIHAQYNQDIRTKNDLCEWVGNESHLIVMKDQLEMTDGDKHITVTGDHNEKVGGTVSLETTGDMQEKVGGKHALDANQEIHLKAGMKVILEANSQVTLKVGGSFVDIGPSGVTIQGSMVKINSGGSAGSGSGSSPESPRKPKEADTGEPGGLAESGQALSSPSPPPLTPQAQAFKDAAQAGKPLCDT